MTENDSKDHKPTGNNTENEKKLSYRILTGDDYIPTRKLIADGYAQRRNLANRRIIFSIPYLSIYFLCISFILYVYYNIGFLSNIGNLIIYLPGITIAFLSFSSRFTETFIPYAKKFMSNPNDFTPLYGPDITTSIVEFNNEIVAVISSQKNKKSNTISINYFAVLNRYRKTGLGKDLLSKLIKDASKSKYKSIQVKCFSLEKPAIKLFKTFNFKLIDSSPYNKESKVLTFLNVNTLTFELKLK